MAVATHGPSRSSLAQATERLEDQLSGAGVDAAALAEDLFGVTSLLAGNPGLRRALADQARPVEAKSGLVHRLLGSQVSSATLAVLDGLVGAQWTEPGDLTDAVEALAVEAVLVSAERGDRFDAVEDELFRFSRTVAGTTGLRDAFAARTTGTARKTDLVKQLLAGKVAPETLTLAVQAATATRGLRTEQVLRDYLEAAARRRRQLVAAVVVATPLGIGQRARLSSTLSRLFDRPIRINETVDPQVVGGIRIEVGGELYDSTVLARLQSAQRALVR